MHTIEGALFSPPLFFLFTCTLVPLIDVILAALLDLLSLVLSTCIVPTLDGLGAEVRRASDGALTNETSIVFVTVLSQPLLLLISFPPALIGETKAD